MARLGRWGSLLDPSFASGVAELSVGATACLVVYVLLRKRRLLATQRPPLPTPGEEKPKRSKRNSSEEIMSLSPPAGWPSIEGMQVSSHTNGQGLRLLTFRFETAKRPPKAGVVLVHGVGVGCRHEFLRATFKGGPHARYEGSILQVLRDAGITVLTYDQQSLGDSQPVLEGKRCYFHRFDDLAHDLLGVRGWREGLRGSGSKMAGGGGEGEACGGIDSAREMGLGGQERWGAGRTGRAPV